jgi:hypothetical protein
MQWQTAKNDFIRENLEEKTRSTMDEMVKLLVQSGSIPPEALQLLVNNGNITPSLAGGTAVTPTPSQTTEQPRNADDVIVPILPIPPKNENITITFPCQNFTLSENNMIRARGMETHIDPQIAKSIATVVAIEELASKIEISVNSVTDYYFRSVSGDNEELGKDFKRQTKTTVNQTLRGYRIVCEEYRQNTTTQKYQCFIAVEISEENVLKPVYDDLKQNKSMAGVMPNYEKFKKTFDEVKKFYENTGF